jgi:formyl-CoA transferase
VTAAYAVFACLLGCRHAREVGAGRLIYVSAHEALTTFMQQGLYEAAFSGRAVKRGGNRHAHIAASGALKCQDGYVVVSANERRMWQQLVELVGDDRLRDPALNDERVRMARQAEIFEVLETWAGRFTKAELSEIAQSRGIPIAPVHDVDDLLEDPHLRARRFFRRINGHDVPALTTPWPIPGGAPVS